MLALTPITVAMSRHNNPDALLTLCCVAALWCAVAPQPAIPAARIAASDAKSGMGFRNRTEDTHLNGDTHLNLLD